MPASWKLTCFLVITMCVGALGRQLVPRNRNNTSICRGRNASVIRGTQTKILVAEAPTSDGQVQDRSCRRADTDFSYPANVNFSGTSGQISVYVEIDVTTNEEFDIVCEIQIQSILHRCTSHIKVIDEDCPREGLTNSSEVRIDPDKPSYGSGEEIKYDCEEDSLTVIGPSTRTCQGPKWHPPLSSSTSCLGRLAAPGNVFAETNGTIIFLNWSVPSNLTNGISIEHPDVSNYTVYITNINTNQSGLRTVTDNSLIFSGLAEEDPSPCRNYSFIVIANNVVGKGEQSKKVFQHFERECQAGTEDKRLWVLLGVFAVIGLCIILSLIACCIWKKQKSSKQGTKPKADVGRDGSNDENTIEKNGTHQKNGNKARKGDGGDGVYRRPQSVPTLEDFMNNVGTKSKKWKELGQKLGLSSTSLAAIADKITTPSEGFEAVYKERKKIKTKPFTWAELFQALKSTQVGEDKLAESLKVA